MTDTTTDTTPTPTPEPSFLQKLEALAWHELEPVAQNLVLGFIKRNWNHIAPLI